MTGSSKLVVVQDAVDNLVQDVVQNVVQNVFQNVVQNVVQNMVQNVVQNVVQSMVQVVVHDMVKNVVQETVQSSEQFKMLESCKILKIYLDNTYSMITVLTVIRCTYCNRLVICHLESSHMGQSHDSIDND